MEDYNNIRIVLQPENLTKTLFKHQLASIYEMEKLEREKNIETPNYIKQTRLGINADETGYGKTLSMIGLISRDKMEWDFNSPFVQENLTTESCGLICKRQIYRFDKLPTTLILVSPSIISQWKHEFSYTNLRVESITTKRHIENINVANYDVILVTPTIYNNLIRFYRNYAWKRFIFDEPGHLRVSGMLEIVAGFNWFVSATPEAIIYQHVNCYGSFMKKVIGDDWRNFYEKFEGMILKNDSEFVKASFEMPQTNHYNHECYQFVLQAVRGLINDNVNTMIAAGNIEGAISALGGEKTQNIVEIVRDKMLKQLEDIEKDITIHRDIRCNTGKLHDSINHKERITKRINELDSRFDELLHNNCSICMSTMHKPVMTTCCQNIYCGECILTWLKTSNCCPICRGEITPSQLIYLSSHEQGTNKTCDENKLVKKYTQLEKVLDIIKNNTRGKFLIFSAYDVTFKPICKLLRLNNISYVQVKGTHSAREKSICDFKYGNTQVIFLNSNFNGAGINLQEATDIILYHEMPITTQNQIIGRANRIGRTIPLSVHHLKVNI